MNIGYSTPQATVSQNSQSTSPLYKSLKYTSLAKDFTVWEYRLFWPPGLIAICQDDNSISWMHLLLQIIVSFIMHKLLDLF